MTTTILWTCWRVGCCCCSDHPKMVLKYASMPKALPLTGWSQKAQSLSPIFSLQGQHSRWPEIHWAILVDISPKQMWHFGLTTLLLFLTPPTSLLALIDSVEVSSVDSNNATLLSSTLDFPSWILVSIESYFLFNSWAVVLLELAKDYPKVT